MVNCVSDEDPGLSVLTVITKSSGVLAGRAVEPHFAALVYVVGDEGVQVAVPVQIAQRHVYATGASQSLAAVGKASAAVVEPHPVVWL